MIIFGGDISINGTGIVKLFLDDEFNIVDKDYLSFTSKKYIHENSNGKILYYDTEQFPNYIEKNKWFHKHIIDFVKGTEYGAIENYAFAAPGKTFHIGEFTGLLKYFMYEMGIKLRLYAPTTIKKFASSYGGSGKTLVVDAYDSLLIKQKFDLDYLLKPKNEKKKTKTDLRYESPRSDIIDAYWLSQCLLLELKLRNGLDRTTLSKRNKEIFIDIPNKAEANLLDSEFLSNDKSRWFLGED